MAASVDFKREFGGASSPRGVSTNGVRLNTIALPVEHGGWGITLEPILLGLLIAPSAAGAGLAVATVGAFLARHPFKIVAGDRRPGRRFQRTPGAGRVATVYACVALAGLAFAPRRAARQTGCSPALAGRARGGACVGVRARLCEGLAGTLRRSHGRVVRARALRLRAVLALDREARRLERDRLRGTHGRRGR